MPSHSHRAGLVEKPRRNLVTTTQDKRCRYLDKRVRMSRGKSVLISPSACERVSICLRERLYLGDIPERSRPSRGGGCRLPCPRQPKSPPPVDPQRGAEG